MKRHTKLLITSAAIALSMNAPGANQVWDSGGADQNWETSANWGGDNPDTIPAFSDSATIANGDTALFSAASGTESVQHTTVGGGSTLIITGGFLSNTQSGNTIRNNVGSGSAGTVNQSGGTHIVAHMLRIGHGGGGNGTYNLTDGYLRMSRGGISGVSSSSTSLDIGVSGGMGLFKISGGSVETRTGVGVGADGIFRVEGGSATNIAIGSNGSVDGHWEQDPGGVLDLEFDIDGLTPIFIDYVDGTGASGNVYFASGALLDVGFAGALDTFGYWEVMSCEGAITDDGLTFAPGVDTNQWSFSLADKTGSGEPDTLQVLSIVNHDGTWTDATNTVVNWTDNSRWSGGVAAYGPNQIAYFDALNHIAGKTVNLPTDIVIGTIRYRDNGAVNRDMTIATSNGSKLIMSTTVGTPRIWARNRSINVDVGICGTNGLELQSEQSTRGVVLKQRNSYSGVTTVLAGSGVNKTVYPGDFGDSDLVVQGALSIDHSRVLQPTATLEIAAGNPMDLNYAGALPGVADFTDLLVSELRLAGVLQPDGVYNATTHPAFFSGTGEVAVESLVQGLELSGEVDASSHLILSWAGRGGRLYDILKSTNLASNGWTNVMTVAADLPTNTVDMGMVSNTAAFHRVEERPHYAAAARAGVMARIDGIIANSYLPGQNLTPGDIRHGQFHNSDNMRMAECTPVLVWAYMQPDSQHYGDTNVLNRAIWSIDHMCRAQGINGGFNEYHGWCGVPVRTNGKSSVVGFTLHALGNAITLMESLPEMQPRLLEYMDPNGTGSNDTQRVVAWKNMLSQAMPFQFSGNGRGHAPNQDLCGLMGVYAVNEAYAALDGGTLLKTQAEIDTLSNEIYYGYPTAASSNPNGQWFSSTGMLGEHGHGDYGYDGNYGAVVTFHYLGVLAPLDSTTATFLTSKYAEALQYFFVADEAAPLGIFAENGISRRSTGEPLAPRISALAVGKDYHPALQRMHDIMLPKFAEAPLANMSFSSPHHFQVGVWHFCEWADILAEPDHTGYRLPTEQADAFEFRDDTMKLLVTKQTNGIPVYYTEIWDTADKARRHVTGQAAETIDSLYEF